MTQTSKKLEEKIPANQVYIKTGSINMSDRMDIFRNNEGFAIHKCWDIENQRHCTCSNVEVVDLGNEKYFIGERIAQLKKSDEK